MEHLQQLLTDLEFISFADISAIPEANQHVVAERLEELQDELKLALFLKEHIPQKNIT